MNFMLGVFIMAPHLLPRYLRVAHWLHEQQRWVSSREAANVFCVSIKTMSDDFAKLRGRPDIVEFDEQKISNKNGRGGWQYLLRVVSINAYMLDGRQYPRQQCNERDEIFGWSLAWRELLTRSWVQMDLWSKRRIE
jgi:hypothetical protein